MIEYALHIPTYSRAAQAHSLVLDALGGQNPPARVYYVDNGSKHPGSLIRHSWVWSYGRNIGVAAAWNSAMRRAYAKGFKYLAIVNDDVKLSPHTLTLLVQSLSCAPPEYLLAGCDWHFFACFVMRLPECIHEIGFFDDIFQPAYYEDSDYWYRMQLKGKQRLFLDKDRLGWDHEESATTKGNHAWRREMLEANAKRFVKKWGGRPGFEIYSEPYNPEAFRDSARRQRFMHGRALSEQRRQQRLARKK